MRSLLVNQFVGDSLVKGVVKVEGLVVQVLGKVHFVFWLMDQQCTLSRYSHNIYLLPIILWNTQACTVNIENGQ